MDAALVRSVLSVLSGGVVGFVLGLIGGGGSIMALPLLVYVVGVRQTHVAIGTTALAVAVNAFLNLIPHARKGNVDWRSAVVFAVPGAAGAAAGSALGKLAGGGQLLFLFALLMLVVSVLMVRRRPSAQAAGSERRLRPGRVAGAGAGAGLLSGFFGIGGGFLIVPGLILSTGMSMVRAVGTSLFSVGAFGLTTAVSYALSGLVDWRIALEYIAGGVGGGLGGAWLAARMGGRSNALTYVFSGVVFLVAVYMIYVNYRQVFA
jgi:uncharacterized membrane protein YfcA